MKTKKLLLSLGLLVAATFIGLQPLSAKIVYVGKSDSQWEGKTPRYTTPNLAFSNVDTEAGDEIWIAEGTYSGVTCFSFTNKQVSFYGGFAGTENSISERQKEPSGNGWEFTHPTTLKQGGRLANHAMFYLNNLSNPAEMTNISIDGLVLEGNENQVDSARGIYCNTGSAAPNLNVSIKNCIVKQFGSTKSINSGVYLTGTAAYNSFVVDSCLIEDNKGNNGGGVYITGPKILSNSIIRNNTSSGTGGGVHAPTGGTATITNCLIEDNQGAGNGGGIYITGTHILKNSVIQGNTFTGSSSSGGGGIYLGTATVDSCTIEDNISNGIGGGVYVGAAGTIKNSTIRNDSAANNGGGIYIFGATTNVTVDNCLIESNKTGVNSGTGGGGGLYISGANKTIKNSIVRGNRTVSSNGGGIYFANDSLATIDGCLIENNYAGRSSAVGNGGGGIYARGKKIIRNSTIRGNTSVSNGGGILLYQGTATNDIGLTLADCLIDGNKASAQGGGIAVREHTYKYAIYNCIVVNNETVGNYGGGGISILTSGATGTATNTTIFNLTIADNKVGSTSAAGAGIYAYRPVNVYNSIFCNNTDGSTLKNFYSNSGNNAVTTFNNNIIDKDYTNLTQIDCIPESDASALYDQSYVTLLTSPGINMGTVEGIDLPATDYAGNDRVLGGTIDIGPYEYAERFIDNTSPSNPANLTLKAATGTTLTLEWDVSTDDVAVTSYAISYNDGSASVNLADFSDEVLLSQSKGKLSYMLTGLTASTQYDISVKAKDGAENESLEAASATFSTTADADCPVWYVGIGWTGRPINRTYSSVSTAYAEASKVDDAQLWIQGEHTLSEAITLSGAGKASGIAFYGGFAGYESSPAERLRKPNAEGGWDFASPTTLKRSTNYIFYNSSTTDPVEGDVIIDGFVLDGNSADAVANHYGVYWSVASETNSVSIKNCVVRNFKNSTNNYAGGLNLLGTTAIVSFIVDSCLIENNQGVGGTGGGGVVIQGPKTLKNSIIRNNISAISGGGIRATGDNGATAPTIIGCLIEGNAANGTSGGNGGGGIHIASPLAKYNIHNCIVVNNTAVQSGGGVLFAYTSSTPVLAGFSNLTIANNRAGNSGAGIYFYIGGTVVYNSILYNNQLNGEVNNVQTAGQAYVPAAFKNNIIDKITYSNMPAADWATCIITSDSSAIFGENWVTLPTSPGVDKGTTSVGGNITLPTVDYAGKPRITNDIIDIGPYEYMPSIPDELTGLTGQVAKTGVELAWEASEGAAGYRIYRDEGSLDEATTPVDTVSGLSCVVEGLTAATAYTFSVEAFNGGGAAPKVTLQLTTLGASAPDRPVDLDSSSVGETSLTLSWDVQGNDAPTTYIIYRDGVAVDSIDNNNTIEIIGLQVGREYTFTVRAKKIVEGQPNFSLASAPVKVRTADYTAPTAPVNLKLSSASSSVLSLEWDASSDNGVLAGYIISVSGTDTAFTDTLKLADISDEILAGLNGKMRYTLSGLATNADYSIEVKAFDGVGLLSNPTSSTFSTNDQSDPVIWYAGNWIGKPADRVKARVDSAFVAAAEKPNAQVWVQGEHTIEAALTMNGRGIDGFSLYGGFAGYENSPDERAKVGEKGWEFANPTKIKKGGSGYAIHSRGTSGSITDEPPVGNIVIDGLVLEGNSSGDACGIAWQARVTTASASVSIRNCIVQNFGGEGNTYNAGGMWLQGEVKLNSFIVENCLVQGNRAKNGGGIAMDGYRTIRNCEIRNNVAYAAPPASPTTPDSLTDPKGVGGGIYVYSALGAASITGCIVEGNTAHSGGGIFLRYVADSAGVHNNVVVNNTAGYGGGLSFCADMSDNNIPIGRVSNLTVASNRATVRGAGVYFADSGQQVYNTIFWSNLNTSGEAPEVENVYVAAGIPAPVFSHNIIDRIDYGNLTATACIAATDSAALFGAGWVTLLPSVAEDAGIGIAPPAPATAVPATDIAGQPRVIGGAIDIGPYEYQVAEGAPSTPQNLDGVPHLTDGKGEIILHWDASIPAAAGDGVASYTIYLKGDSVQSVPAPRTTDTVRGLDYGIYTVQVAAVSASGKVSPKTPNNLEITILANSYNVTINKGEEITITAPADVSSTRPVPLGSSLEVKFRVDERYENPVVLLDGEPVTPALSNGEYSYIVESDADVTLSISATLIPIVTIAADNASIIVSSPTGGNIHPTSAGTTLEIRFSLKAGYENPTVKVGGEDVDPLYANGVYTVSVTVTADVTVTISATPATPAPPTGIDNIKPGDYVVASVYYNLQGREVRKPAISGIYILKETYASRKVLVTKRLVIVNE
ncbi:MAG: fibronectin type III domain-containing protein [Prevotellaceae bacterium]|nr:fibronectin type III domain-containing protein [Prevotellaceae bacterium]